MARKKLKVISVGSHPELLWLRDAVLRSAGFNVFTTTDVERGMEYLEHGSCGVLLMCYSLPRLTRKRLAETFRLRCPFGRVVMVMNKKGRAKFADFVVYSIDGPDALLEAVRNASNESSLNYRGRA
jgi:DNA-binding NtrC family response regulator